MAINKVEFGEETLIDLSNDTLQYSDQLLTGITAHNKLGEQIVGTMSKLIFGTTDVTPSSNSTTLTIPNVSAEPIGFWLQKNTPTSNSTNSITIGSTRTVMFASSYNGTSYVYYSYKNGNTSYLYASKQYLSRSYNSSTKTLTLRTSSSSNGGYFTSSGGAYKFFYFAQASS